MSVSVVGLGEVFAEVRATIAFQCYSVVVKIDGLSVPKQYEMWANLYHGVATNNKISCAKRFMSGSDDFAVLFEQLSNGSQHKMVLREILHRHGRTVSVGNTATDHITLARIMAKSMSRPQDFQGEAIHRAAKLVIKNGKKILPIAEAWLVDGNLPSGKNLQDFADLLIDEMHKKDCEEDGKDTATVRNPKASWRGFLAFLAWGPLPLSGNIEHYSDL